MTTPDDTPYVLMIGMDLPADATTEQRLAFSDGYSQIHIPEVVESHPGFVRGTRFELIEPDPRGDLGPQWVVVYEIANEAAVWAFIDRVDGGPDGYPVYRRWTDQPWSMRWRVLWARRDGYAGSIGKGELPYLMLIGMDAAEGSSDADLEAFQRFYDDIHVPEVVAALGLDVALRYERLRAFDHPAPGCPRFMAAYLGREQVVVIRSSREGRPPISDDGPPAWKGRNTQWRLFYRRVSSYGRHALIDPGR